jgi:predicted ATP-grasp superfamily ATP-dependent carboligase
MSSELEPPAMVAPPVLPTTSMGAPRGAIILAGSHGAIALARVLARQGLDVWFVTNFTPLPRFSRAIAHWPNWPGAEHPGALAALEAIVRDNGLEGYLLIPAADGDVKFAAQNRDRLSTLLTVLVPGWGALQWAGDKSLTYQRAAELGLGIPRIYPAGSGLEQAAASMQFPVVMKPSMRIALNRFTRDKAWRADDLTQFRTLFRDAAEMVGADNIVVQEYIPGGGETQFSYAGLWWHGKPVVSFSARRTRQYPVEFSYTSTFVETVDDPAVIAAGEAFLRSINHHGLCEIEFKRDPRSGELKLLDVNPRPWSWFGLADAAGVDFGAAIVALCADAPVPAMAARPGVGWMFMVRDIVVALQLALAGKLDFGAYLQSALRTRTFASFSWRDPMPGLLELPLTLARIISRARPQRRKRAADA